MRRGVVVWLGCWVLLAALVAPVWAERDLSEDELRDEMAQNRALEQYIERNGMPDLAAARFLADTPPWDDHEVALYYLDRRQEVGFARAYILGRPSIEIERYRRPLTDEQVAALAARARQRPVDAPPADRVSRGPLGPAERAEESARRAEDAAARVEQAAESAERAAERAEAVTARMEQSFHRSLRK